MLLHVLVPCIILSTVVPLVLPCTAFYLLLKRWSDQWTIVSVRMPRPPPSSEPVGFVALRMLSGCLLVYQLAMTGFFLLKGLCRSTLHSAAPTAPLLSPSRSSRSLGRRVHRLCVLRRTRLTRLTRLLLVVAHAPPPDMI